MRMFRIREPFASGVLYENDARSLKHQLENCFMHKLGPKGMKPQPIIAGMVPHNSILSSGPIAAWLYSRLERANYILLGPVHKPMKHQFAVMKDGLWKTPLGELLTDSNMANKIAGSSTLVEFDMVPHQAEHSIEMQIPFLQYRFGNDAKFVPILVSNKFADEGFLDNCSAVGDAIANAIKNSKDRWIVIASSDLSSDKKFDKSTINTLLKFDGKKLFTQIKGNEMKMCGFGSIATAIVAAKKLGARKAKLLKYANASQVIKNQSSTGYASLIFY